MVIFNSYVKLPEGNSQVSKSLASRTWLQEELLDRPAQTQAEAEPGE